MSEYLFQPNESGTVQRAVDAGGGLLTWLARAAEAPEEGGAYRFVASTEDEDRHGDIIDQASWRLNHHNANPVFLYEHGHTSGEAVIGKCRAATVLDGSPRLELSVEFHLHPLNTNAIIAEDAHRTGFRNAVSVGFMPGSSVSRAALPEDDPRYAAAPDGWSVGRLYRFNELLEVSSVGIPSNRQALQQRAYMAETEDPEEQVRRYLKEAHSPKLRGFILDAIRADDELRKSVQLMILGTPRAPTTTKTPALPWLKS